MQRNLDFFNARCCWLSPLFTPLLQQHIALVSGISQPCNSSSELHAPVTTCRMSSAHTEVQRPGGHPNGAVRIKFCFSCACMRLDGWLQVIKCGTLSWRQQQVTASVPDNAAQLVSTGILRSAHKGGSEAALDKNACVVRLLATGRTSFLAVSADRGYQPGWHS